MCDVPAMCPFVLTTVPVLDRRTDRIGKTVSRSVCIVCLSAIKKFFNVNLLVAARCHNLINWHYFTVTACFRDEGKDGQKRENRETGVDNAGVDNAGVA